MSSKTLPRSRSTKGIAYYRRGSGPPVLLIHGVGLCAESWLPQIESLQSTSTVYAVDLPGHGESPCLIDESLELSHYVDQLSQFIDEFFEEPTMIAGHSMGAMIALELASRYPQKCRGVAALNAIFRRSEEASTAVQARAESIRNNFSTALIESTLQRWFGDHPEGLTRDMALHCREWLQAADHLGYANAYEVFARGDGPTDEQLQVLSLPALFLTGDNDLNSSPEMSRGMASLCRSGEVVIIEGAGHVAQATHPAAVTQALVTFNARCKGTMQQFERKIHI